MASRTPVVASDIEGYALAAAGHAELFPPGDATDLNRALSSALTATAESREAAYRHAESYSMSRLMDRYLEIYERSIVAFSRR
jgi:glycosyltransferase involved in cell wall biosynthesis